MAWVDRVKETVAVSAWANLGATWGIWGSTVETGKRALAGCTTGGTDTRGGAASAGSPWAAWRRREVRAASICRIWALA